MIITPSSIIKVLRGVPLDIAHKNVSKFDNVTAQLEALVPYIKYTLPDCTYVKETNKIRMNRKADDIYDCNYIMYQNPSYGLKWFFAFITNVEYKGNTQCEISFEIDHAQTWLLGVDYNIMPSFVEREHVEDDDAGNHILDEGLAINDYIANFVTTNYFTDWYICVGSTVELYELAFTNVNGVLYGGIYSGLCWYVFDATEAGVLALNYILNALASTPDGGKADAIVSMFMLPKDIVPVGQEIIENKKLMSSIAEPFTMTMATVNTLDGYTPRNKKLLTYPYRALVLENNEGNANILRYEFFTGGVPVVEIVGGTQPNSKILAYPKNYKGLEKNLQESVSVGNYPQCCWQKDVYSNWLASQSVRWGYQGVQVWKDAAVSVGTTAASGAMAGTLFTPVGQLGGAGIGAVVGALSGANSIANFYMQMSEEKEVHSMIPNSIQGTIGNGYTNVSIGKYGFQVECKSIKAEVAKSIDGYFDMFGYKVNALKVPNVSSRPHWNYVKTSGITIIGNIPADSLAVLSNMYNNGVTFWKDITELGDYSLDNSIV